MCNQFIYKMLLLQSAYSNVEFELHGNRKRKRKDLTPKQQKHIQ